MIPRNAAANPFSGWLPCGESACGIPGKRGSAKMERRFAGQFQRSGELVPKSRSKGGEGAVTALKAPRGHRARAASRGGLAWRKRRQ